MAIPALVKPQFQAKLYAPRMPALGSGVERCKISFGTVHAMLLSAGPGLTSAFVYTEVPPEQVIEALLFWRQGEGTWQEEVDAIYSYEGGGRKGEVSARCPIN